MLGDLLSPHGCMGPLAPVGMLAPGCAVARVHYEASAQGAIAMCYPDAPYWPSSP